MALVCRGSLFFACVFVLSPIDNWFNVKSGTHSLPLYSAMLSRFNICVRGWKGRALTLLLIFLYLSFSLIWATSMLDIKCMHRMCAFFPFPLNYNIHSFIHSFFLLNEHSYKHLCLSSMKKEFWKSWRAHAYSQ